MYLLIVLEVRIPGASCRPGLVSGDSSSVAGSDAYGVGSGVSAVLQGCSVLSPWGSTLRT